MTTNHLNISNRLFWLAIFNHILYVIFVLGIFALAGFKTHGDGVGGLMMVYGLTFFVPQLIIGIYIFAYMTSFMLKSISRGICRSDLTRLLIYYGSIFILYLMDFVRYV